MTTTTAHPILPELPDTAILIRRGPSAKVYPEKKCPPRMGTVRLYPESPNTCGLQIRSLGPTTDHAAVNKAVVSHASLGWEQAKELHAALGAWIERYEKTQFPSEEES